MKISIDGEDAYVSQDYVTVEEKLDTAITMTELLYGQGVSDVRVDLVEYAKQFIGNPYVWGGTSLTKGADCSGFVLSVFKKYGITLSHSSRAQANEGTKISASELKPGDLVFYGNGKGNINHVAIYIGGGQVIHASSPKTGIKISSYKYRTPVEMCPCHSRLIKSIAFDKRGGAMSFLCTNRVGDSLLDYSKDMRRIFLLQLSVSRGKYDTYFCIHQRSLTRKKGASYRDENG